MNKRRLIIVGGGFAGVEMARNLAGLARSGKYSIKLISSHGYFEYYPGVYRIMIGETPIQTKVRLNYLVPPEIEIIEDTIERIDTNNKKLYSQNQNGANQYDYDDLVLALGSVPKYFNIEGLETGAFTFRTTGDAVVLRNHLHEIVRKLKESNTNDALQKDKTKMHDLHIIICGGGPIGVELAGSLSTYMRDLARTNGVSPDKVTIDLIDGGPRILPRTPEKASKKIMRYLGKRGVNLFLNRPVLKLENETVIMDDVKLNAKTIVWTGGVIAHPLYQATETFKCEKGRVLVGKYMDAVGVNDVYVLGDGANTKQSGLAQTAIHDGKYMAKYFKAKAKNKKLPNYTEAKTGYVIPIGSNWALLIFNNFVMTGLIPGFIRYFIDIDYFFKRLPIATFLDLYWEGIKYRRRRYIIDEEVRTSLEGRNELMLKFRKTDQVIDNSVKSNQSGRVLTYIVGFLAIIFIGVIGLGYITNRLGNGNPETFTATSLFK